MTTDELIKALERMKSETGSLAASDVAPVRHGRWIPEEHAARLFLKVTDVRVERLHEIDAAGIRQEGLVSAAAHCGDMEIAQQEFALLWDSTIKPADLPLYSWDANPWVWVIEFDRISREEA